MNYEEIEIEGMKELLKEKEIEIEKLRKEKKKLKAELTLVQRYENIELEVAGKRIEELEEENKKLKELNKQMQENYNNLNESYSEILGENQKLGKELSAVYKAYHTAMGVDYNNEEDLYTIEDIEGHNAE